MEIDSERKKELVMEKKLRACRVNIIPRVIIFQKWLRFSILDQLMFRMRDIFNVQRPQESDLPHLHH